MRKHWYTTTTAGAALLATVLTVGMTAGPAYAAGAVLTTGGASGADVAVGDIATAGLPAGATANLFSTATGSTGISCAGSAFTATVLTNPAAPGTATESLTGQTFTSCTANVTGVTRVVSVTVNNLPYTTTVSSGGAVTITGGAAGPIQTTVVLGTLLGTVTCVYQATGNTLQGTAANTDNSISFSSQPFTRSSGPATCFTDGYFTTTYAPVIDQTVSSGPVIVVN
jgi:hypothetical protein